MWRLCWAHKSLPISSYVFSIKPHHHPHTIAKCFSAPGMVCNRRGRSSKIWGRGKDRNRCTKCNYAKDTCGHPEPIILGQWLSGQACIQGGETLHFMFCPKNICREPGGASIIAFKTPHIWCMPLWASIVQDSRANKWAKRQGQAEKETWITRSKILFHQRITFLCNEV